MAKRASSRREHGTQGRNWIIGDSCRPHLPQSERPCQAGYGVITTRERQHARAIHQFEPIDVVGLKFATCLDDGFADAPDCFSTLALRRASDHAERTEKKQSCMRHCPGSGGSLAALARGQRQKDPARDKWIGFADHSGLGHAYARLSRSAKPRSGRGVRRSKLWRGPQSPNEIYGTSAGISQITPA
jgi:hypothetical protein